MEWIRAWMMSIAGTIVFGVICEMLMPKGNIQKYIRIVLGMLLVFTVVKPVMNFNGAEAPELGLPVQRSQAYAAHQDMEETQKEQVMQVYSNNLKEKIGKRAAEICGGDTVSDVSLKISEEKDSFGEIQTVSVHLYVPDKEKAASAEDAKKYLAQEFDIDEKNVQLKITADKGGT